MNFPFIANIDSIERTKAVAKDFSKVLRKGDIVSLIGNLGSGKTTFVKFICGNFKIYNVNSPSFSIVNEYSGSVKVYHFDFYRLKNIEELYDIGFEDYLNDTEAIILIEWGHLMEEILPSKRYEVNLKILDDPVRKIKIDNLK